MMTFMIRVCLAIFVTLIFSIPMALLVGGMFEGESSWTLLMLALFATSVGPFFGAAAVLWE